MIKFSFPHGKSVLVNPRHVHYVVHQDMAILIIVGTEKFTIYYDTSKDAQDSFNQIRTALTEALASHDK